MNQKRTYKQHPNEFKETIALLRKQGYPMPEATT